MSKHDLLKIQSHVLKVNIHCKCEGCEQKIKKLLQKIDGVYSVSVDAEQGKVVVTGDVDPSKLLKKLKRSGKHAEIWGAPKTNQNYPFNPQFQNSQLEKGFKKDNKSQNHKGQKGLIGGGHGQGQQQLVAHFPNVQGKGAHDLKVPSTQKGHKSIKFNLPEEEFDKFDDGFGESDDNYDDYDDDEEEEGYGHGHVQPVHHLNNNKMMPVMANGRGPQAQKDIGGGGKIGNYGNGKIENYNDYDDEEEEEEQGYGHVNAKPMHHNNKMMPMMGNGRGPHGPAAMVNGPAMTSHKNNGGGGKMGNYGSAKRDDDFFDLLMEAKGKNGNFGDSKNGDKKGNGDQKGKNNKGENNTNNNNIKKKNMKSDGGLLGRFLSFGKKSKKGIDVSDTKMKNNNGGGNKIEDKEAKKGEGKLEAHGIKNNNGKSKNDFNFHDFDFDGLSLEKNSTKGGKGSNGHGNGDVGRSAQMGPMGQMKNVAAVQGQPAMNGGQPAMNGGGGGYYQGMQMQMQPTPYDMQHMAMMMNQHHQQQANMMNNMYPSSSMMYGRPHPSTNYMPPPPMPSHPMADPITHTFSDENVESCSVM